MIPRQRGLASFTEKTDYLCTLSLVILH